MPQVVFPGESSQLAAIQSIMPNASLWEVHQAIEELTALSQKTGGIAQSVFSSGLFEAALERTDELNNQEIALNHEICLMREEIGDLAIAKDRFTPEQIADQLDALQQRILSCAPTTRYLQNQVQSLEKELRHLHFLFAFPAAEELNPDSFQSNLISRLNHQIETLRRSDPAEARVLEQNLLSFQQQCQAAEDVYCERGWDSYRRLSAEIRLDVERHLFAERPGVKIEQVDREIAAHAIMASLADRMVV
jgi:hypothetical protein